MQKEQKDLTMMRQDIQKFLTYMLSKGSLDDFFWNVLYLAKNDLEQYSGPRDDADYYRIIASGWGKSYERNSKILLDLYKNLKHPYTQELLGTVADVAPLLALPSQQNAVRAITGDTTLDCYEKVILNINLFSDQKLKYDLLTRIINRIKERHNLDTPYRTKIKIDERTQNVYDVAIFYRSRCGYTKTFVQDMYDFMRFANPSNVKRDCGEKIRKFLLQEMSQVIKNSKNPEKEIKNICAQAYEYIAGVGAENQDLMDATWDTFDYEKIIGIPAMANRIINRKTK